MIDRVEYRNYRALRDTTLPLGLFTLIVGSNGSGKSTALKGLWYAGHANEVAYAGLRSVGNLEADGNVTIRVRTANIAYSIGWSPKDRIGNWEGPNTQERWALESALRSLKIYAFQPDSMCRSVQLDPNQTLSESGHNLVIVLDGLRDQFPERFDALNAELHRMLPEFDRVLFTTPQPGQRGLQLRTTNGGHRIDAAMLSQGTLLALAVLTLAYLPAPPPLVCIEEPDHGLHPRLLGISRMPCID